ncbi:MAG TPA: biotin carboxylase N-terminal domain-containing protein [Mycobacteriales bacterium]|nr:biotin carboxylase N-terminal domain-containing protein [Mycobacteriales bacterium]
MARLLVANRGEIARRVIRTCRSLGVSPVAVHSTADSGGAWVDEADHAVELPGAAAADTYLRADLLVDAAVRTGADAVHPGYGFLAEDAGFARAVLAAGLTWVGPPPEAIAAMGSKVEAKDRVAAAGVPVLPSWSPVAVPADAAYPLLVKASHGGGGRGMRVVAGAGELAGAVAAARREAAAAFGDGTVFVERWLSPARHIEVQVLADSHGTVLALGERDCSVQRRHQKIVEEAPAALPAALRRGLHEAAVAAARSVGYVGAGTVEFLVAADGTVAFLEMNTRLQVEHPVTELVTGLDLVALQLSVAEGAPLPFATPPPVVGHAIEARLYAEDPAADWRPSTGVLTRFDIPGDVRVDAGVRAGDEVGPHYDPLLAKVVAHAPTRAAAARALAAALAGARVHGLTTNRDLLVRVLRSDGFAAGPDTAFLSAQPALLAPLAGPDDIRTAALVAALAAAARPRGVLGTLPAGWRNSRSQPATAAYRGPDGVVEVTYRPVDGVVSATPERVVLVRDGVRTAYRVDGSTVDGPGWTVALSEVDPLPEPVPAVPAGSLVAPMPGLVVAVHAAQGDRVSAGQPLLALEAMKMEHTVLAPADGVLAELRVGPGTQVDAGGILAVIEPEES